MCARLCAVALVAVALSGCSGPNLPQPTYHIDKNAPYPALRPIPQLLEDEPQETADLDAHLRARAAALRARAAGLRAQNGG